MSAGAPPIITARQIAALGHDDRPHLKELWRSAVVARMGAGCSPKVAIEAADAVVRGYVEMLEAIAVAEGTLQPVKADDER